MVPLLILVRLAHRATRVSREKLVRLVLQVSLGQMVLATQASLEQQVSVKRATRESRARLALQVLLALLDLQAHQDKMELIQVRRVSLVLLALQVLRALAKQATRVLQVLLE